MAWHLLAAPVLGSRIDCNAYFLFLEVEAAKRTTTGTHMQACIGQYSQC